MDKLVQNHPFNGAQLSSCRTCRNCSYTVIAIHVINDLSKPYSSHVEAFTPNKIKQNAQPFISGGRPKDQFISTPIKAVFVEMDVFLAYPVGFISKWVQVMNSQLCMRIVAVVEDEEIVNFTFTKRDCL